MRHEFVFKCAHLSPKKNGFGIDVSHKRITTEFLPASYVRFGTFNALPRTLDVVPSDLVTYFSQNPSAANEPESAHWTVRRVGHALKYLAGDERSLQVLGNFHSSCRQTNALTYGSVCVQLKAKKMHVFKIRMTPH